MATLTFIVTDATTGAAIAGASVVIGVSDGREGALPTDGAGRVTFSGDPGYVSATINAPGYQGWSNNGYVDGDVQVAAALTPAGSTVDTTTTTVDTTTETPPPPAVTLAFHVTSAKTGAPLAGAHVTIQVSDGRSGGATTDANGDASFHGAPGFVTGRVALAGYVDWTGAAQVDSDRTVAVQLAPVGDTTTTTTHTTTTTTTKKVVPKRILLGTDTGAPYGVTIDPVPPPTPIALRPYTIVVDDAGVPHLVAEPGMAPGPELALLGSNPWVAVGVIAFTAVAALFGFGRGDDYAAEITDVKKSVLAVTQALLNYEFQNDTITGKTSGLIDSILHGILGPLIDAVAAIFTTVAGKLNSWFGPFLDILRQVAKAIRNIYDVWLKPILKVIDTTRQILKLLELLHVKGAAAVDQALANLEAKLTKPILGLLAKVNELSNWTTKIVTLNGTLQRVLLLQSMIEHAGGVSRVWWNSQTQQDKYVNDFVGPIQQEQQTTAEVVEEVRMFLQDDAGPLQEEADQLFAELQQEFS